MEKRRERVELGEGEGRKQFIACLFCANAVVHGAPRLLEQLLQSCGRCWDLGRVACMRKPPIESARTERRRVCHRSCRLSAPRQLPRACRRRGLQARADRHEPPHRPSKNRERPKRDDERRPPECRTRSNEPSNEMTTRSVLRTHNHTQARPGEKSARSRSEPFFFRVQPGRIRVTAYEDGGKAEDMRRRTLAAGDTRLT